MGRTNFRDANEYYPYAADRAGGLLGMLQAMMREGQDQRGSGADPRGSENGRLSVPLAFDYGETPPTRITVRPNGSYLSSDSESYGGESGLPGEMPTPPAEPSPSQSTPVNGGAIQFAQPDPNFRQVSRAPVSVQQQQGTNPVLSDASPDPIRPGSQYAQSFCTLDPTRPALTLYPNRPTTAVDPRHFGVGAGLTRGLATAAAALLGATILNAKRRGPPSKKPDSNPDEDEAEPD